MPEVTVEEIEETPPIPANAALTDEPDPPEPDDHEEEDEDEDEEPERRPRRPVRPPPPAARRPAKVREPMEKIDEREEMELARYIESFGDDGPIRVDLSRISPTQFKGVAIKGKITTFYEPITEDQVQEYYGGGKYEIRIHGKDHTGSWRYRKARRFDIAGLPKLDNLPGVEAEVKEVAAPILPSTDKEAFRMAEKMIDAANARAERAEQSSGTDWEMINATMIAPLRDELKALNQRLEAKDAQIAALTNKPPDRSNEERLFSMMDNKESAYANSLAAIRTQHESEMRSVREHNRDEMRRVEERLERAMEHQNQAHLRELDTLKDAHKTALNNQKLGYENRILALNDTIDRLKADDGDRRSELATLRAKKDISPLDQITQLGALKDAFETLSPSSEPDTPWWQEAIKAAAPRIAGFANQAMSAVGGPPAGDPNDPIVTVRTPDGREMQMPRSMALRLQQEHAAAAAQGAGGPQPAQPQAQGTPPPDLDPESVKMAVRYIEGAFRNNTDPRIFAQSAIGSIPQPLLNYLAQHGVDAFLNNVAKLEPGSPIATVAGRKFVKNVAAYLTGAATEGNEEESSSPVDS